QSLGALILGFLDVTDAGLHDQIVDARVRELRQGRILFDFLEITEKISPPCLRLAQVTIFADQVFELSTIFHFQVTSFGRWSPSRNILSFVLIGEKQGVWAELAVGALIIEARETSSPLSASAQEQR